MNVSAIPSPPPSATAHPGSRHLLYVNAHLGRFNSAIGEHARRLAEALAETGATVATFPTVDQSSAFVPRAEFWRPLKRLVQRRAPRRVVLRLIELYLLLQGVRRTVVWSWIIWRTHHRNPPELIVARAFEYDWSPWISARLLRRPLALEVHAPFDVERQLRGRGPSTLFRALERAGWRRADRIWAVSPKLAEYLAGQGISRSRLRAISLGAVVDPGVPTPDFERKPGEIVFMGSFFPWHGVELLLRAFERVRAQAPAVRLRLIGDGMDRASCEALTRSLGLEREVVFTGWLPYPEAARQLRRASIGVAPYLPVDLFYFDPVKILDYMAAGLPVVASDQGQIPQMLDHGRCGVLVPPGDLTALSAAILELVESPLLRSRLGAAARQRTTAVYGWGNTARQLLDHCDDLFVNQSEPSPRVEPPNIAP